MPTCVTGNRDFLIYILKGVYLFSGLTKKRIQKRAGGGKRECTADDFI